MPIYFYLLHHFHQQFCCCGGYHGMHYGGYTLVTLLCTITPYRDSVDGYRDRVTYQKLVTRSRYGLVRCAVGIWPSHQKDDRVTVWAGLERNVTRHHRPLLCPSFHSWCFCLEEWCESVVLCGLLSVLVIVKWSGLRELSENWSNFIKEKK